MFGMVYELWDARLLMSQQQTCVNDCKPMLLVTEPCEIWSFSSAATWDVRVSPISKDCPKYDSLGDEAIACHTSQNIPIGWYWMIHIDIYIYWYPHQKCIKSWDMRTYTIPDSAENSEKTLMCQTCQQKSVECCFLLTSLRIWWLVIRTYWTSMGLGWFRDAFRAFSGHTQKENQPASVERRGALLLVSFGLLSRVAGGNTFRMGLHFVSAGCQILQYHPINLDWLLSSS